MGRVSTAKARLLDAAIDLVWCSSYGAVTIDAICEKAGVKKGSFYYFFKSKADLVAAGIDREWERARAELDRIFSPTSPPLERLRTYFSFCYTKQAQLAATSGHVLGCVFMAIGCEVTQQEKVICEKVQELTRGHVRYFESVLRDAAAEGLIADKGISEKARGLYSYIEGVLTQARIQNNLEMIRDLSEAGFRILGIAAPTPALETAQS
jgi:TetR/AcrR family transcriptional repressor of nem operon